jgi:hypothetical protein
LVDADFGRRGLCRRNCGYRTKANQQSFDWAASSERAAWSI